MQYKTTVLIANGIMNAGGTETLVMEILRHQTGRIRYILMVHYQGEIQRGIFDDEIRSLGVEIVYIPSVGSLGINEYCRKFKCMVDKIGKIDIIHSHLNANSGIICKAAKMAGIPYRISHCHADIRFRGNRANNLKEEVKLQVLRIFVNKYSNHYWACSHEAWKRLFYFWKKEVVVPNMIDVQKYLSTSKHKQEVKATIGMKGKFVVGSVGRVARIKNYELILKAIAILNKRGCETHFVCYGRFDAQKDAYCKELQQLSDSLGITDKVHFKGNTINVTHDIKAFDVFLMPSITEGFGMAAIEAQAAGIPTLLSIGIPRIVDVGLGLVKFMPFDPKGWANEILKIQACSTVQDVFHEDIIVAFDKRGYNSASMVRVIEDKYLEMIH